MGFLRWLSHALNHQWGPETRHGRFYIRLCTHPGCPYMKVTD